MYYDKDEIKNKLTTEQVFELVQDFGGEPQMTNQGFVAATICHNHPGEGSHKLYYYNNSKLFRCYTGCDATFDIFELVSKVRALKAEPNISLYSSVKYVAQRFGFASLDDSNDFFQPLDDWKTIEKYDKIKKVNTLPQGQLQEYNDTILQHLPHPLIRDWMNEGISLNILQYNQIGYYPSGEQITIPHFDINGRFIGLRGRFLGQAQAEYFGKYRPVCINGVLYNHPLGYNLYNLNNSKKNIQKFKKAIIFEGEKSVLLYQSYFGLENDISVACCGSSISLYQIKLLLELCPNEIIVAFDRQFQTIGDEEYKQWVRHLKNIYTAYHKFVDISFIFDKWNLLGYKDAPVDKGKDVFLKLYKQRIRL